jgi:GNAT superfamily N-acetyltransferase
MTTRSQRLVALYRSLGLKKLVPRLARRTAATVYAKRVELLIVKRLDPGGAAPGAADLRIEPAAPAHASLLARFNDRHRGPAKIVASAAYLKNGYRGFLAFLGDELIGYWWWVSNATHPALTHPCVERFGLRLENDEVFAFDYFIAPDHRARGAAIKFLTLIYRELAALGYRGVWGSVDADNTAARWVYHAQGNKVVRRQISHEVLTSVLFQDRRVYVRNTPWHPRHPFERRLLFSLRSKKMIAHGGPAAVGDLSTHGVR